MTKSKRLGPDVRRGELLDIALDMAESLGLEQIRRDDIAKKAGVANGLVTHYFSTMTQLKRAVVRAAIERKILPVIAQALALKHPEALKAPDELRNAALASLAAK
ncbi:MAG: TetR/AcrR family transcriptional regulator [Methylocystis sp.]|uniref:TetR/AcrR family transcriptional regulator n=1 Tax=Methylocystis sp. TaxID=1911079 RepID=UPI003DA2BFCF